MRNSATCKDLPPLTTPSDVVQTDHSHGRAHVTAPSAILNLTPPHYEQKAAIKLPSTPEEWEDANSHFHHILVPQVLAETTPDAKNNRLSDEIYNFFASNYGTRQTKKKKRRQEKHVKALNVATRQKNEARKELRQAKTNDAKSPEEVMSLARKFFQVLRSHSQCKRAFQRTKRLKKSRCARDECHKNFWPFTKQLLDGSSRSNVEPGFSKEEASHTHIMQMKGNLCSQSGCHVPLLQLLHLGVMKSQWMRSYKPFENPSQSQLPVL